MEDRVIGKRVSPSLLVPVKGGALSFGKTTDAFGAVLWVGFSSVLGPEDDVCMAVRIPEAGDATTAFTHLALCLLDLPGVAEMVGRARSGDLTQWESSGTVGT